MAEADRYAFTHKEVVVALIKQQGLHEGLWQFYVEFGLGAANAGPDNENLQPVAIVPIVKIGLQRATESSNLTADATEVNPTQPKS